MEMYHYSSRTLFNIADNYEEYDPEASANGSVWYKPKSTAVMLEYKADFDTARDKLPPLLKWLIHNDDWHKQWDRMTVFSEMAKMLNGDEHEQPPRF